MAPSAQDGLSYALQQIPKFISPMGELIPAFTGTSVRITLLDLYNRRPIFENHQKMLY
jgi:hypothetical protein